MRTAPTIFLLSPAYCGGRRAAILLNPASEAPLSRRLHEGTLTLGEAFSFMSGLYFRGKLTYANAFGRPARAGDSAVHIITPTRGLLGAARSLAAAKQTDAAAIAYRKLLALPDLSVELTLAARQGLAALGR